MEGNRDEFHRLAAVHLAESARLKREMAGLSGGLEPRSGDVVAAASVADLPVSRPAGFSVPAIHAVVEAAELIAGAFRGGGKLLLCGNGGSAADCQHVATEFTNILDKSFRRRPLPAIALTTDTSFLTAFANDYQVFSEIFSRQIRAIGKPGDALLAISTSGSSPNILHAAATARAMGIRTIALTGEGGELAQKCDVAIAVPSRRTAHIQEAHLALEHVICDLVERLLFPERGGAAAGQSASEAV